MDKKKKSGLTWVAYIAIFLLFWITGWHKPLISMLQQGILATGLIQADIDQEHSEKVVEAILYNEEGQKIRLSDFRNEIVFMNIWATWCPPCKAEMPGIQTLYESVENVNFIMLSTDENFEKAKKYKNDNGYTFPIYRIGGSMSEELNSSSLPTTFIIGKKGNIELIHKGMAQYDSDQFRSYLERLAD